jgi:Zn-dependent protease with chaperone function
MDFFELQHRARRNTALMVLLFVLAVAAIVALLNLIGVAIYIWASPRVYSLDQIPRSVYGWSTAAIVTVIAAGTAYRFYQLSEGGAAVARMIRARPLAINTEEPSERRLLNVVEEMALASGVAVPRVFVMDDQDTINGFAAGYSPNEAAIIVTRGTLKNLGRDELQGVIAHEFSHVLNGDMRLNIILMGVIAGIVLFGAAGAAMMTGTRNQDGEPRLTPDFRVILLGLLLWILGSIGVLASRVIKALISREREFLADASAVQFTRNPEGIGGALLKIDRRGSEIVGRHAEELSHMCIGSPTSKYFEFAWLSTHPPIEDRIERILGPAGKRLLQERAERARAAAAESAVVPELTSSLNAAPAAALAPVRGGGRSVVDSVGRPTTEHLDYAQRTLKSIPEVRTAVRTEPGAEAAVFALLLGEGDLRDAQLAVIGERTGAEIAAQTGRFADALKPLGERMRLPVLTLALPTLRQLPQPDREKLLERIKALIDADGRVTLREFVLLTLCRSQLGARRNPGVKYRDIDAVRAESEIVLSLLAHAGKGGMAAFDRGMAALGGTGGVLRAPSELNVTIVENALNELALLAPLKKPILVKACAAVAMADDKLMVAEAELLRAICAVLDSPLPPILETLETEV